MRWDDVAAVSSYRCRYRSSFVYRYGLVLIRNGRFFWVPVAVNLSIASNSELFTFRIAHLHNC